MSWGTEPEMDLGLAPPKPGLAHVEEGGVSDWYVSALHCVHSCSHVCICMYMSVWARSQHLPLPLSTLCFETMSH